MTGQTKKDPLKGAGLGDLLLFRVFHGTGLTHNVDLDLAGIVELVFDLLGQVAGQQHHIVVPNLFGVDQDADLAAGLEGEALFHATLFSVSSITAS